MKTLKRAIAILNNNDIQELSDKVYTAIINAYSEPHRFYHNVLHIEHMINTLIVIQNILRIEPHKFNLMVLAIAFHDYIYIPAYIKNEKASADMSEIYCNLLGLSHKDTMDVRVLILDTENSSIRNLGLLDKNTDIERKLIHDIDLAIFAAPWDKFYEYDSGIMSEYITLGKQKDMFDRQREFFLKSYLSKNKIYFTDYCYNQFEEKARENITRILAEKYG